MKSLGPIAGALMILGLTMPDHPTLAVVGGLRQLDSKKVDKPPLEMSKPVVCKKIEAYEKYQVLPDATLTSEDKLVVYYRPLQFKVEAVEKPNPGHRYRAKFTQDGRIRRKGEKTVLMKKDLVLEYEPFFETTGERLYLVNNMSLKGLAPGDYEYDIILHDVLDEGSSVTQSVSFTIIPVPKIEPAPKTEKPGEPESSPGSKNTVQP